MTLNIFSYLNRFEYMQDLKEKGAIPHPWKIRCFCQKTPTNLAKHCSVSQLLAMRVQKTL